MEEIKRRIKAIALQLNEDDPMSRSELAYCLKKYGVEKDSQELSRLVYEVYQTATREEKKKLELFMSNDGKSSLLSAYTAYELADKQDIDALQSRSENNLVHASKEIEAFTRLLGTIVVSGNKTSISTQVARWITGAFGSSNIQEQANNLLQYYGNVVAGYSSARQSVERSVQDFIAMRDVLLEIYYRYSESLIDIFGEELVAREPELFDFSRIEYLSPQDAFTQIRLEFSKLDEKCTELMAEIVDSFGNTAKRAISLSQATGDNRVKLLLGALTFANHYIDATTRTAQLKQEFLILQSSAEKDIHHLSVDLGRLELIYQTLERLLIPKVDLFSRFSKHILSEELEAILTKLYHSPRLAELNKQREQMRLTLRRLRREIDDCGQNILYYEDRIASNEALLASLSDEYLRAKEELPKKPLFILNILTFGSATKTYNKKAYKWQKECAPLVKHYESIQADVKMDKEDLENLKKALPTYNEELKRIELEYQALCRQLRQGINVDPLIKQAMYPHFEGLLALLRAAKELIAQGLDERHLSTISESVYPSKAVVAMTNEELALQYLNQYRSDKTLGEEFAQELAVTFSDVVGLDTQGAFQESDLATIVGLQNEVVDKAVVLYEELLRLERAEADADARSDFYRMELSRIQAEFKNLSQGLEQQAQLLSTLSERIKFASSSEERKTALCLLAGIDQESVTQEEWSEFLAGKRSVII